MCEAGGGRERRSVSASHYLIPRDLSEAREPRDLLRGSGNASVRSLATLGMK